MRGGAELAGHAGRLQVVLAAAEVAFRGLPRVGVLDGCGYCYAQEELQTLGGDPGVVPADLVRQFAQESPSHWGRGQYGLVWRGLATRIVGMVVEDPKSLIVEWMLRGPGAPEACFDAWPVGHQEVLVDLYTALLGVAVASWSPELVVDALDGMAHLPQGLGFWLARVEELEGPAAGAGFVRLTAELAVVLASYGKTALPWFWCGDDLGEILERWLTSAPVRDRLARFASENPTCGTAALAVFTIENLEAGPRWQGDLAVDSATCDACGIPEEAVAQSRGL